MWCAKCGEVKTYNEEREYASYGYVMVERTVKCEVCGRKLERTVEHKGDSGCGGASDIADDIEAIESKVKVKKKRGRPRKDR